MQRNIALVTGAGRPLGLGFAVARLLAEGGHHVVISARDLGRAEARASELRHAGLSAEAIGLDLSRRDSIRQVAERLTATAGHLDVLVNNATHGPDFGTRSVLDIDPHDLATSFAVDVFGCFGLVQALLPLLRRAPVARIVNVSSIAAQQVGRPDADVLHSPAYALAKHTLNVLTTTLAGALAATPIRVNAVDPGRVASHPERGDDDDDRPALEAARGVVWAATLGADGPTGGLFSDGERVTVTRS